jgi:hypothetical protein
MQRFRVVAVACLILAADAPGRGEDPAANSTREDPVLAQALRAADTNNDGKIDPREFDGVGGSALWAILDANNDREVTLEEVKANLPAFLAKRAAGGGGRKPRPFTGLVPINDLAGGTYKGKEGGLYPGGRNDRPAAHEQAGLRHAHAVRPVDAEGRPAPEGRAVLLSIGMSNTTQEFSTFKPIADADPARNPRVVIVDGAQGAMTASVVSKPDSAQGKRFWDTVDRRLEAAGVTPAQVQVAWIKEADAGPGGSQFEYALALEQEHVRIVQLLKERFPNLALCYLSSRIYGGYATAALNPEPYAYEGGFAVKWLIEKQLKGDPELNFDPQRGAVKAPWLAWGPYLWADGQKPRSDGLTYDPTDLRPDDGTHPGLPGRRKVARLLLEFFKNDSTARVWFLGRGD